MPEARETTMGKFSNTVHMERMMLRQAQLWEAQRKAAEASGVLAEEMMGPYIALSRDFGSGGPQVARSLAERLGWQLYDQELVDFIATEAKVRREVVESFDEKAQNEIEAMIRRVFDPHALDPDHYLKHLATVVLTIAKHGRAIFVGRGARFILPPEHGLRVKISAPFDKCVENIMRIDGVDRDEAKQRVRQRYEERFAFIQQYFRRDPDDPDYLDLMINTAYLSVDAAVEICLKALEYKLGAEVTEKQTGSEVRP
jgi:cytidylate kinase